MCYYTFFFEKYSFSIIKYALRSPKLGRYYSIKIMKKTLNHLAKIFIFFILFFMIFQHFGIFPQDYQTIKNWQIMNLLYQVVFMVTQVN